MSGTAFKMKCIIFILQIILLKYHTHAQYPTQCSDKDNAVITHGRTMASSARATGRASCVMVDVQHPTANYGFITKWAIQPNTNSGTIKVGIYRNTTGNFSVIGENTLHIAEQAQDTQMYIIPRDQQIFVEPDDYIGYRSLGNGIRMDSAGTDELAYVDISSEDEMISSPILLSESTVGELSINAYIRPIDHLNCYPELIVNREMNLNPGLYNAKTLTIGECYQLCKNVDYTHTGLREGGVCVCGQSLNQPALNESFCQMGCGDDGHRCGGDYHNDVYQNPDPVGNVTLSWAADPLGTDVYTYTLGTTGTGVVCHYYLDTNHEYPTQSLSSNTGTYINLKKGINTLTFSVADVDGDLRSITETYNVEFDILSATFNCPSAAPEAIEVDCNLTISTGSNVNISVDFGTHNAPPTHFVADGEPTFYGSPDLSHDEVLPFTLTQGRYVKFNTPIKEDAQLIGIQAYVTVTGTVHFEVLRPKTTTDDEQYCFKSNSNIPVSESCDEQTSAWTRQCSEGRYSFGRRSCKDSNGNLLANVAYATQSPSISYEVVKQYEITTTATGFSTIPFTDVFNVTKGDVIGWLYSGAGEIGLVNNSVPDFFDAAQLSDSSADLMQSDFGPIDFSHSLRALVTRPIEMRVRRPFLIPNNDPFVHETVTATLSNSATSEPIVLTDSVHVQKVIFDVTLTAVSLAQRFSDVLFTVPDHIAQEEAMYRYDFGNGDIELSSQRTAVYNYNATGTFTTKVTAFNHISRWTAEHEIWIQDNITSLKAMNISTNNPDYDFKPTAINQAAAVLWTTETGTDVNLNVTISGTLISLAPEEEYYQSSIMYGDKELTDLYILNDGVGRASIDLDNANIVTSSGTYNIGTGWTGADTALPQTITVDLKEFYTIHGIITRGSDNKWTTTYGVSYSAQGIRYTSILVAGGDVDDYDGNIDLDTRFTQIFKDVVVARYFKITVMSHSTDGIGMKFDLLGQKAFELCRDPLGMEDSRIVDSQITASSNVQAARRNSGVLWQPSSDDVYQWIQVDLQELKTITALVIQKDLNDKNNGLLEFSVAYSLDGYKWRNIREPADEEIGDIWTYTLSSSTDIYDEWVGLPESLTTRYIRIRPISWSGTPSMAFEIHGCNGGRYSSLLGLGDSVTASGTGADVAKLDSTGVWSYSISAGTIVHLDISFEDSYLFLGIVTQGHPTLDNWILTYKVQYSVYGIYYTYIKATMDSDQDMTFTGNSDSQTKVRTIFPYPVLGRKLKLEILTWSTDIALRYSIIGSMVPMIGIEPLGTDSYSLEFFRVSSGSLSGSVWTADASDALPWIHVDLSQTSVVTGVMLIMTSGSGFPLEVQCSYSDDAFNWNFFTDDYDNPFNFTTNISPMDTVIMFPEQVLARYVRIHIIEYSNSDAPALHFDVLGRKQGRGYIRFTANEAMNVSFDVTAYNHLNAVSFKPEIVFQEYITFYHLVHPAPFPIDNNLLVVIHTDLSTDPVFEGIFDSAPLNSSVFSYDQTTHRGLVDIPSDLYSTIGDHNLTVIIKNLVSGPYYDSVVIRVQYLVTDLSMNVSEPFIKTDYQMFVTYDVDRGSDMNCTIDMGDGNVYERFELVMLRPLDISLVTHTYRDPGTYVINVTCVNDVSIDSVNTTVIVQNEVTLLTSTYDELVPIPVDTVGILNVTYVFSGLINRKPTDAIAFYNFTGDNTFNHSIPLIVADPSQEFVHRINTSLYGSYQLYVCVFNLVSEWCFDFHLEIEEIIDRLDIQPEIYYYKVDEPAVLTFSVYWGSRITYEITDFDDGSTQVINPEDNTTITHPYSDPGFYRISVTATNLVSTRSFTMTQDLIIQHPVVDFLAGSRTLNKMEAALMYCDVPINLFRDTNVPHPTDAHYTVDYGNYILCSEEEACRLDDGMENYQDLSVTKTDYTNIFSFLHTYELAGVYTIRFRLWNLVSDEEFIKEMYVFEEITELEDYVKFNTVALGGAAAAISTYDTDYHEYGGEMYVPLERATVFTADFTTGTGMTYVWNFADIHQPSSNYSIITTTEPRAYYWYTKPGTYVVTLNASNPVHFQTVSSTIIVQSIVNDTFFVDRGPMARNYTATFDLQLGFVPTDACYYINFIDETSESFHIQFFGTYDVCKAEYPGEFKSPYLRFTSLDSLALWEQKFEQNSDDTDLEVTYKFMTTGGYNMDFIVHNYVSRKELTVFHSVTLAPCFTPVVIVEDENLCDSNYPCHGNTMYREYFASVEITIHSSVTIDCKSTKTANYTWTISKQGRRSWTEYYLPSHIETYGVGMSRLVIEKATLDYGTYQFQLNVSMVGEIGIWSIDSTTIVVVPSPLKIGIEGGEIRSIPWDQTITVDASPYSYDPDIPMEEQEGITWKWQCRRMTYKPRNESIPRIFDLETFQVWNSDYTELLEESVVNSEFDAKRDPEDVGGCFGRYNQEGSPSPGGLLNYTVGKITFNTTGMYWDMLYELSLVIIKGDRRASITQLLDVNEGEPPDMAIICRTNCAEKKNPTNRFSLEGRDKKWKRGVVYYYRWEIFEQHSSWVMISAADWVSKYAAGTGNAVSNLSLEPGLFREVEWYRVQVVASRNKDFSNYGISTLTFITNERPTIGYCTVEPEFGYATETEFLVSCFNFTDVDKPLSYVFEIRASNNSDWTIIHTGSSAIMPKTTQLGPGDEAEGYIIQVRVTVTDGIGSFVQVQNLTVQVIKGQTSILDKMDELLNDMKDKVSAGDTSGAANMMIATASVMNSDANDTDSDKTIFFVTWNRIEVSGISDEESHESKLISWLDGVFAEYEDYVMSSVVSYNHESFVQVEILFLTPTTKTQEEIFQILTTSQTGDVTYESDSFAVSVSSPEETLQLSTEFRKEMIILLRMMSTTLTKNDVNHVASALAAVAARSDQLTMESKLLVVESAENFEMIIAKLEGVSAESIENSVKHTINALEKAIVDINADENEDAFTTTPSTTTENLPKSPGIAKRVSVVIGKLQDVIASSMVTGQSSVSVKTKDIEAKVDKTYTDAMNNKTFDAGGNDAKLPSVTNIVGEGNETTSDVETKVASSCNNPHGTGGVTSPIVSMDMKNDTGQEMSVEDTDEPFVFTMCPCGELKPTGDNTSTDIVWLYMETTMTGTPMEIAKLQNIPGESAMFLTVKAIEEDPGEDEEPEIWDVDSFTLYVYISINQDEVKETNHHFNCTLPQIRMSSDLFNATLEEQDEYSKRIWNNTVYSELLDGQETCFFSNTELKSYLNDSLNTVNVGIRHVWGVNVTDEEREEHGDFQSLRYAFSFFTSKCMYFDEENNRFSTEGMEVLPESDRRCTVCTSNHLSEFGGGFSVPMNTIDLSESAFTKLGENPVVFVFMTVCICIYTVVVIWARKEDQRDKMRAGVTPMSDNDPRHNYNYEITFFTGVRKNSSTTANVSFIIQGENGETGIRVVKDKKRKLFERGGIDSFLMAVPKSLGTMVHLRIWHDNKGKRPSWFLSRASIKDLQTNRMYYFMLDKWLAVEEDDGQIERIIPVAGMSELTSFGHLFYSRTRRNLSDAHLWFSVFMRPAKSTFTRCERATCCLSLLFCTMMANIFFYGQDVTGGAGSSLKVGPIELSLGQIVVGVISSLMVVPANVIVVQLFRLSKPMTPKDRCCGCCRPQKKENKYKTQGSSISLVSRSPDDFSKQKSSMDGSDELKEQLDRLEAGSRVQSRARSVSNTGIDVMVSQEKPKELNEMKPVLGYKKTKKKKKDPNPLPWWCAIFGWILAWMTIGVAFWLTIEVAGGFGKEKATEWLTTIGISLAQDILVSQPIKVLLLATIFSLIIKTPDKEDDSPSPHLEKDEEWLHERLTEEELEDPSKLEEFEKQKAAELANSLPPDEDEINEMREFRFKEMQMTSILREVTIYMVFLYILMTVSFGNTDPTAFALRETMLDSFVHASYHGKMPFSSIASRDYFWNYTQNVFIPSLFAGNLLNGEVDEFGLKQALLADHTSSLVGIARLRQLRVIPNLCEIPEIMSKTVDSCRPAYGAFTEDDRYFHERWVLANQTHPPEYSGLNNVWRHQSWFDLGSLPYWGIVTVYGGGGYVAELGKTVEDAWAIADYLRSTKWVDQYTRAIFFEFTVYNPVINFYAVSYMIAEFLPQGGALPYYHFQTLKLDRYFGPYSYIVLAAEAALCVFTLWFAFKEFKLIKKLKKKYFKSLVNMAEFITLVLSVTAFVMYMYRTFVAKSLMTERNENPSKFLNFQYVGQWDQMFCWMVGLILFISTIKFIKLLRFNKRMLLLSHTIKKCWMELLLFFMMFAVIFASYACAGFMLFGNNMIDYYTMVTTLESLFATLLGNFNFDEMVGVNRILGPAFFFSFTLTIVFVLMNMFITIINEAFSVAKEENEKLKNEVEIVDFMIRRFKEMTGFAERRNLKPKRRHKYVEGIEPIQVECDEMQQKLVLMVDQLNDFIRKEKAEELGEDAGSSGPRPIYTTD